MIHDFHHHKFLCNQIKVIKNIKSQIWFFCTYASWLGYMLASQLHYGLDMFLMYSKFILQKKTKTRSMQ